MYLSLTKKLHRYEVFYVKPSLSIVNALSSTLPVTEYPGINAGSRKGFTLNSLLKNSNKLFTPLCSQTLAFASEQKFCGRSITIKATNIRFQWRQPRQEVEDAEHALRFIALLNSIYGMEVRDEISTLVACITE